MLHLHISKCCLLLVFYLTLKMYIYMDVCTYLNVLKMLEQIIQICIVVSNIIYGIYNMIFFWGRVCVHFVKIYFIFFLYHK